MVFGGLLVQGLDKKSLESFSHDWLDRTFARVEVVLGYLVTAGSASQERVD